MDTTISSSTPNTKLRPYQKEAISCIRTLYKQGARRQLVILPTGTGKTIMVAGLVNIWQGRTLMLAHREELVQQAYDRFMEFCPGKTISIEQGTKVADYDADVIIASVPTLGRTGSDRILNLDPDDKWLVISDEAHHSPASTYQNIYKHFRLSKIEKIQTPTNSLHVGVTATPKRSDSAGLEKVFDIISYKRSLMEMIQEGWLCDILAYSVRTGTDISNVDMSQGDFKTSDLEAAVNHNKRNKLAVKSYMEIAPNTKALVFCVDIAHAVAMSEAFKWEGLKCEAISSATPIAQRRAMISDFRKGKLPILCNVGIFLEGFDVPDIETVILARPTMSEIVMQQQVGRGTRIFPGKKHLNLIDLVDNCKTHSLASASNLSRLPPNIDISGRKITDVQKVYEEIKEKTGVQNPEAVLISLGDIKLSELELIISKIDLFSEKVMKTVMKKAEQDKITLQSKYVWCGFDGSYFLQTPTLKMWIDQNNLGQYFIEYQALPEKFREKDKQKLGWGIVDKHKRTHLYKNQDIRNVFDVADKFIGSHPDGYMADRKSSWRSHEASDKQKQILRKLNIPVASDLTRGQASMLIDSVLRKK